MPEGFREGWANSWLQKGLRPVESASYTYQNAAGSDIVRKVRFSLMRVADGKDSGEKTFVVQHRSIQSLKLGVDRWEPGIGDLGRDLLYRRVDLELAIADGRLVVLCEGERDADSVARKWGLCSTAWYQGAAGMTEHQAKVLLGAAEIYIMADRDLVGYQLAHHHFTMLVRLGYPVKRITIGIPAIAQEKADISDHISAGLGPESVRLLSPSKLANKIKKHGALSAGRGGRGYGYGGNDDLGEWVVTRA